MHFTEIKENEIYSLKLISGEEVIGKVVEATETMLWIRKPLVMIHSPQGIGFMNYMLSSDDETYCFDRKSHVIVEGKTSKQISDAYYENTTNIHLIK